MDKIIREFLDYFKITKVNENIFAISEDKIGYKANCFLIVKNRKGILIDCLSGVFPNFIKCLEEIYEIRISKVLLTHAHYDHFNGFDGRIINELFVGKEDAKRLKKYYLSDAYVRQEISINSVFPVNFDFKKYKVKKIKKYKLLSENDDFVFEEIKIKVIETPGHSPGSLCFYMPDFKYLFTGDFLYLGEIDLADEGTSINDYLNSLIKLKGLSVEKYLVGHNYPIIEKNEISLENLIKNVGNIIKSPENNKNFGEISLKI